MGTLRAHLLVGGEVSNFSTTRRGTAAAGMIPVLSLPSPSGPTGGVFSQGRRPAESRHACTSIRVLQNGGQPIHTASTRRGNLQGRSSPRSRPTASTGKQRLKRNSRKAKSQVKSKVKSR